MHMNTILVLGAGRSSYSLITHLLQLAPAEGWNVVVGDSSLDAARARVGNSPHGKAIAFDIHAEQASHEAIAQAAVVVSLLPAHFHPLVAKHCLQLGKHLLNASYVSDEIRQFHNEAQSKGLLFLCECGLDPGIDHMSAMQVIDRIKDGGGQLLSFESFTGGLIAPDTDPDNPWRYKFTWNPRNVVMAGQGTAKFLRHGQYKYIPYQQLFKRITPVSVPGYGQYEGYVNRDSLKYRETYALQNIETLVRGTLRNEGFCSAWDILVQAGCCDDTYAMEGVDRMTHRSFLNAFLEYHPTRSVEEKLVAQFSLHPNGPELARLRWSGLFNEEPVGLTQGTPAQILEHILNKKWALSASDKDQIVMWHRFVYKHEGATREIQASLIATGEDSNRTAMAKTVGLPLALAARLVYRGEVKTRGVAIPVQKEFYDPVLAGLKALGIELQERHI